MRHDFAFANDSTYIGEVMFHPFIKLLYSEIEYLESL